MAVSPLNAAILGTGMTRFGRMPGEDLRSLSEAAVAEARWRCAAPGCPACR
jgi:hypothetical protein